MLNEAQMRALKVIASTGADGARTASRSAYECDSCGTDATVNSEAARKLVEVGLAIRDGEDGRPWYPISGHPHRVWITGTGERFLADAR